MLSLAHSPHGLLTNLYTCSGDEPQELKGKMALATAAHQQRN